jgi:hypothetical protein
VAALLAAALALAGCGGDEPAPRATPTGRAAAPASATVIAALAPLPGGGLRYGELRSGRILDRGSPRVVARVRVSTGGQRGLLGLAVTGGRTYAAYTEPGGMLVVDRVLPAPAQRVWTGPRSARLANGGHLAVLADGRLAIGIGDLGRPELTSDPDAPNGKLLALDPRRPEGAPEVLSGGWNNPFAFDEAPGGAVWVADNAPGRRPERLGSGTAPGPRTPLPGRIAPSGLVALPDGAVVVCGVVSGTLERFRRDADGTWRPAGRLPGPCRYGVVRLDDGTLVASDDDGLREVGP